MGLIVCGIYIVNPVLVLFVNLHARMHTRMHPLSQAAQAQEFFLACVIPPDDVSVHVLVCLLYMCNHL